MPSTTVRAVVGAALLTGALVARAADVGIGVFLKTDALVEGDRVEYYISGFNTAATPRVVDVHVGVIHDGMVYEYPDWNNTLTPWLSSFTIPANYHLPPMLLGNLDSFPGGLTPGVYKMAVALTEPGTENALAFEFVPFVVADDGATQWFANGTALARGESPTSASVVTSAAGSFNRVTFDPTTYVRTLNEGVPTIDQCIYSTVPLTVEDIVGEENIASIDAGASLLLSSPGLGSVSVTRTVLNDGGISYYNGSVANSFLQGGKPYIMQGFGSTGIDDFVISVAAPPLLTITEPADLTALQFIDNTEDLVLRWPGNNGVGEVGVMLVYGTAANPDAVVCRFADDGEGTIPSDLLTELRSAVEHDWSQGSVPGLGQAGFGLPRLSMTVSRTRSNVKPINPGEAVSFSVIHTLGLSADFD